MGQCRSKYITLLINSGNAASARWVQCKLPNYLVEIFATALGAHFLLFIHFKKFYLERTMLIQLLYYNHFLQLAQQLYITKIFVYKKCCIIMIKIGLAIRLQTFNKFTDKTGVHCTYYLCLISWKPIFFLFGNFLISHITFYNLLSPNLVVRTEQVYILL